MGLYTNDSSIFLSILSLFVLFYKGKYRHVVVVVVVVVGKDVMRFPVHYQA